MAYLLVWCLWCVYGSGGGSGLDTFRPASWCDVCGGGAGGEGGVNAFTF